MNEDLWRLFAQREGHRIHKLRHYFPAYERHFGRFVDQPVTFVEIGCGTGGSVQMWKEWLGPEATIVGIDVNPRAEQYADEQIQIRIGDQGNVGFLAAVIDEFGPPDAVLDDGSHQMRDMLTSFRFLYPQLASEGVYMVEDVHTSYWPVYGGGLRRRGSFIEESKALVDELNAHNVRRPEFAPTEFTNSTVSMHFYDGIVAFERGSHTEPVEVVSDRGRLLVHPLPPED